MPTPQQLKTYIGQLPPIYRDLILAYHEAAAPVRQYGEGMSLDVLQIQLTNRGCGYTVGEVYAALERLEKAGFFEIEVQDLTYVTPTPLGEELLEAMTGRTVPRVPVPDLPKPTW